MSTHREADRVVRKALMELGWPAPTHVRLHEDGSDGRRKSWAFDAFNTDVAEPWCLIGYVHADGAFEGPRDDPDMLDAYLRD